MQFLFCFKILLIFILLFFNTNISFAVNVGLEVTESPTGGKQAPPVKEEAPPAEEEAPVEEEEAPSEEEVPPEEVPPSEEEVPPPEEEIPPSEEEVPPAEELPPSEEELPPSEEEVLPIEEVPSFAPPTFEQPPTTIGRMIQKSQQAFKKISEKTQETVQKTIKVVQEQVQTAIKLVDTSVVQPIKEIAIKPTIETVKELRENPEVQKVVKEPAVDASVKVVTTVGASTAVTTGFMSLAPLASTLSDFSVIPFRLLSMLSLTEFLRRRKRRNWGVVYDSVTKQPLDPVYVVLKDKEGKEIETRITDMKGRFGFLIKPGQYYIEANKTHYRFPSQKVLGSRDELYENLYHGELLNISDPSVITINIPMDPLDFDWNEVAKRKVVKFNYHWELFKRWFPEIIFLTGFILTIAIWILSPTLFNFSLIWIYLFLLFLRRLGFKERVWGLILDKKTKKPIPFIVLKVFYEKLAQQIHFTTSDAGGRYYALVEPGKYDIVVEEKTEIGYQPIKKYEGIKVKKGVLNKDLFIER